VLLSLSDAAIFLAVLCCASHLPAFLCQAAAYLGWLIISPIMQQCCALKVICCESCHGAPASVTKEEHYAVPASGIFLVIEMHAISAAAAHLMS
jgi:hypothetical protein